MHRSPTPASLLVCLVIASAGLIALLAPSRAAARDTNAASVDLAYKPARTFAYELPRASWVRVGATLDFRAAGGPALRTEIVGTALHIDTDGDGELDVKVEGTDGFVRLRTKAGFDYALRLRSDAGGWLYAASGARVGTFGETRVTLIDMDGDGRYDGFGRDALIVGHGKQACFLSRVINVGGALHSIEVAVDGSAIAHEAYTGPAGRLDLADHWTAQAKLETAVVCSEDGTLSFDLAHADGGLRVPAGRYRIDSGKLALGQSVVHFRTGKSALLAVAPDATLAVEGGGPLEAEFAYRRAGGEVVFAPDSLRWYGRAGEEYFDWKPFGKSPEFTVTDAGVRKEIAKAIFTGC